MEKQQIKPIGYSIGADLMFSEQTAWKLNNVEVLTKIGSAAIENADYKILNFSVTQYQPYGLSVIFIIAQSHIAFHTYPEYFYMQIEISTCGESEEGIEKIYKCIINYFQPIKSKKYKRRLTAYVENT